MKVRRVDFYPDDLIAGIAGKMDAYDLGVYTLIFSLIYSHGGPIDNDPKWIARILKDERPSTVARAIERLVSTGKLHKIEREGVEKLAQSRSEVELNRAAKRVKSAQENGQNGGRPRKKNNDIQKAPGFSDEKLATSNQQPASSKQQPAQDAPSAVVVGNRILEIAGVDPSRWLGDFRIVGNWLKAGYSPELDIYPVVERRVRQPGFSFSSLSYFTKAIVEQAQRRASQQPVQPAPAAKPKPKRPSVYDVAAEQEAERQEWIAQNRGGV